MNFNPLNGTLNPQSNGPLHSNMVIGTLAVDGWAVTFSWYNKEGPGGLQPIHKRAVYQIDIIRCGTIITYAHFLFLVCVS